MSQFDTLTSTLVFALISSQAFAQVEMKSQTIQPTQMKTQEAVAPVEAAPVQPSVPPVVPGANPAAATAPQPIVYGNAAARRAAKKKKEAAEKKDIQDLMNSLRGVEEGGIGTGPGPNGSSIDSNERFRAMDQRIGPGVMESCGEPPADTRKAYDDAIKFRDKCGHANRGSTQKIAVNDYSGGRMPYMYIFDLNGTCLGKTAVAYGNGAGKVVPQPCNDDGSHLTPPGFFVTSKHNGASYNEFNSLGLTGLGGQGAKGRGVVIHPSEAPGTATTWGCSGVGYAAFRAVQKTLGYGALVYNFFGDTSGPRSCRNKVGLDTANHACRLDPGAVSIPAESTGSNSPPTIR